jgi:endonuclease/exonuclease/phosphatase (EEP) superfamily protein YafD
MEARGAVSSTTSLELQKPEVVQKRRALVLVLGALALVHPLAVVLGRLDWRLDLFTHFQEPALALSLLACALALRAKERRLGLLLGLLAATQAPALLRYQGPNPVGPDPHSSDRLRVVMANVLVDNHNYESLAALITRERPDVVGLVEVTTAWLAGLAEVRSEFPYRVDYPLGNRGISLWFRQQPLSLDRPEVLATDGNAMVHATFLLGGQVRHLWLVHPSNPLGHRGRRTSNAELAALAERVASTGGSRLVVGDLNRTEGSPCFRDFLRISGLRDSRLGFGRQPSWPVWSPYRISIDHAFVSGDLAVTQRRLGPSIGSDHRPLILELAPAAAESTSQIAAAQDSIR